jgi:hypothetical protein
MKTERKRSRAHVRYAVTFFASAIVFRMHVFGCSSTSPAASGLMLVIDTDLAPGKDFDRLEVEVRPPAGNVDYTKVFSEFGQPGLPLSFPTTLAVVDRSRGAESVTVRVSIGRAGLDVSPVGKPLVLREIVTTMPTDRVALLRVHLEWLCIGTAGAKPDYVEGLCPEGETCLGGKCENWTIDSAALPTYHETDVFGGGSARGDGACFDTSACFESGVVSVPDSQCSVARPTMGDANVALVIPEGQGGICSGGTCLVGLEPNSPYGWWSAQERLRLAPSVCASIAQKKVQAVVVSGTCPSKPASLPTCGPWSAIKRSVRRDAAAPRGTLPGERTDASR